MRALQGKNREYQLVQKTKQKDIDGTIYLVLGEKDIWVKILNEKNPEKEREVELQMERGYGPFFDAPIDVVKENGKFAGYAFLGKEMEAVLPDPLPARNNKRRKEKKTSELRKTGNMDIDSFQHRSQRREQLGTIQILVLLLVACTFLCVLYYFALNNMVAGIIATFFSYDVSNGFLVLGMKGIIPCLAGVTSVLFIMRKHGNKPSSIALTLLLCIFAFAVGIILMDFLITVIVFLLVMLVGTVQQNISIIIGGVILILIIKSLLQ